MFVKHSFMEGTCFCGLAGGGTGHMPLHIYMGAK